MTDCIRYTVHVSVYRGDPVDFAQYRHTGLFCVPVVVADPAAAPAQSASPPPPAASPAPPGATWYNVDGLTGHFAYGAAPGFDPRSDAKFARMVDVGATAAPGLPEGWLDALMEAVPVANDDPEFNCQQWVEGALRALRDAGVLSEDQYALGVNGMVDATMEAEDEDDAAVI